MDIYAPSTINREELESIFKWFTCSKRSQKKKKVMEKLIDSSDNLVLTIEEETRLVASISKQDLKDIKYTLVKPADEKGMEVAINSIKASLGSAQAKLQSTHDLRAMTNQRRDMKNEKLKKERKKMAEKISELNIQVATQAGKLEVLCALLKTVKKDNHQLKKELGSANDCLKYEVMMLTRELKKKGEKIRKVIAEKLHLMAYYQDKPINLGTQNKRLINHHNLYDISLKQNPYEGAINLGTLNNSATKQGSPCNSAITHVTYDSAITHNTTNNSAFNHGDPTDSAFNHGDANDSTITHGNPSKGMIKQDTCDGAIKQITYGPKDFNPKNFARFQLNVAHAENLQSKILDQEWHLYIKEQLIDELTAIIQDHNPDFSIETTPELQMYLNGYQFDTSTGTAKADDHSVGLGDDVTSNCSNVNERYLGLSTSPKQYNSYHFDAFSSGSTSVPPCSSQSNISGDTDVRDYVAAVMASPTSCHTVSTVCCSNDDAEIGAELEFDISKIEALFDKIN